jgi:hypothetical protein
LLCFSNWWLNTTRGNLTVTWRQVTNTFVALIQIVLFDG